MGAGIGLKSIILKLKGTITVIGTPGEERGGMTFCCEPCCEGL
jgi:metal-dependent amidase/aminoacylase/carboxypeptidase family protein